MRKLIGLLSTIFLLFVGQTVCAQDWPVPDDKSNVENQSDYNLENIKKGKALYIKNCKSCHGDAGKNNALPLVPPPPDVASEIMHANTEGGLYYKITAGKGGMPQFETVLSEDERWKIVNYIMNYSPANEQLLTDAPPIKAKLTASIIDGDKIEILAESADKNGKFTVLPNTSVIISSKKAFGNLEIGQAQTNENGEALYIIPENCVGDEDGLIDLVVSLDESFDVEVVVIENAEVLKCEPIPKLIKKGVLWSTNSNIPLWMLLSYIGAVGAAWLTILYVVFQILKIARLSKN